MGKKMTAMVLCAVVTLGLAACSQPQAATAPTGTAGTGKLGVTVTFDAMKEFVMAVGGDKVDITTIIPDGTEPHEFEPKAQDLVALKSAKLLVYNGLGMEAWVDEAVKAADNSALIAVEASKGAEPLQNTDPDEIQEHGQYDPHLWLSLKGAQIEVKNIRDALAQADPANKDYYGKNCDAFVTQLDSLYQQYSQKLQGTAKKTIVTGHAAFGYLCRDFGLTQNSVEDVYAEGEPTAQQLADLVGYCKSNAVTTVFAEEMASPDVSKTLADEVGAKVETIYTVESAEDGKTYLQRMEDNLAKITDSLTK